MDEFSGMAKAVREIEAEKRAAGTGKGAKPAGKAADRAEPAAEQGPDIAALRAVVDCIVGLEEKKRDVQNDIKAFYETARAKRFNVKSVKIIVKREMEDAEQKAAREATEHDVDTLTLALGAFAHTPLGASAMARAGAAG